MKMSPVQLEFLLWCHYSPERHSRVHVGPIQEFVRFAVREGIITQDSKNPKDDVYQTTEKGKAWIEDILSTPLPIQKWVSGRK